MSRTCCAPSDRRLSGALARRLRCFRLRPGRPSAAAGSRFGRRLSIDRTADVIFSGGIVNRMSNKALDVQDRSTRGGANVQQWSYAGQPNQRWNVVDLGHGQFAIVQRWQRSGSRCGRRRPQERARASSRTDGLAAAISGGASRRKGAFTEVINIASGKCLDLRDKSPRDGANIEQQDCNGADNQSWRFQQ